MNSSERDIPVKLMKYMYSGFSKFYFLVVTYFRGNGTHGEIENILFELIYFNYWVFS